jgi:hypothetical protein
MKAERNVLYARVRRNADSLRAIIRKFPQLVLLDPPEDMKTSIVSLIMRKQEWGLLRPLHDALSLELFTSVAYPLPPYMEKRWGSGEFIRFSPSPDLTEQDLIKLEEVFTKTLL